MQAIQAQQLRTIFAIGRSLGMDSDDLHALVEGQTGKASLKALTDKEAYGVVEQLKERQKSAGIAPPPPKRKKEHPERPGGVTSAQQGKIWALVGELEKWDAKPSKAGHRQRLCGIIKKELGMDAAPAAPFKWMDMGQGKRLIDALARYAESAERKALREGRAPCG